MTIIAKKFKKNKIKLYRSGIDEIESYSLLKLTVEETHRLIDSGKDWKLIDNKYYTTTYKSGDKLDETWIMMAIEHSKRRDIVFNDVKKKYYNGVDGTSCLIRDTNKHIIRIAFRQMENQQCELNILNIDNITREKFFADTHHSQFYKKNKKYAIDSTDLQLYNYWSGYMNRCYLEGVSR